MTGQDRQEATELRGSERVAAGLIGWWMILMGLIAIGMVVVAFV